MADSRRSFLRAMLAACASSLSYSSTLGQIIPSDNAFQAQLSHLYTREGNQLRQIILLNTPPAYGEWLGGGSDRQENRGV